MKKKALFLAVLSVIAGISFAQVPQKALQRGERLRVQRVEMLDESFEIENVTPTEQYASQVYEPQTVAFASQVGMAASQYQAASIDSPIRLTALQRFKASERRFEKTAMPQGAKRTKADAVVVTRDDNGIITNVEGGEARVYSRDKENSFLTYLNSDNSQSYSYQGGNVEVVVDGNDYYIKDIICQIGMGTWVKGSLNADGTKLVVPAGQKIYYLPDYDAAITVNYGDFDNSTGTLNWVKSDRDITYTVGDGTLTLDGAHAVLSGSSISFQDAVLGDFWSDDNSFAGDGEWNTVLTYNADYKPASTELVELPEGAETQTWFYSASKVSSSSTTAVSGTVHVAFVDSDLYVQGISQSFATAWVKGTIEGSTVTFPMLQFLGVYNGNMNMWATSFDAESGNLCDFVMTYDADAKILTSVNPWLTNAADDRAYYLEQLVDISISAELVAKTGANVDAPYTNAINSSALFGQFGVIDANQDGKKFAYSSQYATYSYSSTQKADDWLVSPAIKLEAGKAYTLNFDASSATNNQMQRFEVKMGSAPKVSALTEVVVDTTEYSSSTNKTFGNSAITVAETGYYHFGIHVISDANKRNFRVRNFKVFDGGAPAAVSAASIVQVEGKSGQLKFTLPTKNLGGGNLDGVVSYKYTFNGEESEVIDSVAGAQIVVDVTLKLNQANTATIVAITASGQSAATSATLTPTGPYEAPQEFAFTSTSSLSRFTIIDANADNKKWAYNSGIKGVRYTYNSSKDADDWLITPEFTFEANRKYVLRYDAHSYDVAYPERLEVMIGQGKTVAAMTDTLVEVYQCGATTDVREIEFSVAEAGNYNIGFHAVSKADNYYLDLTQLALLLGPAPGAPGAAENLTVTPAGLGALSATVSFNAPAKTVAGGDLASIIKLDVLRDDVVVKTFENPAVGAQLSFEDTGMTNGIHTWAVVAYNEFDKGRKVMASALVGHDAPAMPEARMTDLKDAIRFDWSPVTLGENGGYVDAAALTYDIYNINVNASTGGLSLGSKAASAVADTTYTLSFNTDEGAQAFRYYAIVANGQGGASGIALIDPLVVGKPDALPYTLSFANGSLGGRYVWLDGTVGEGSWGITNELASDNDGGAAVFQGKVEGDAANINTGKIALAGVLKPVLTFSAIVDGATLKVMAQKRDGSKIELLTLADLNEGFVDQEVSLNDLRNEDFVMIKFEAVATTDEALALIDNIKVSYLTAPELALTENPAFDGETVYYIYNVDATAFVLGANEWGTRASVSLDKGYKFKITALNDSTIGTPTYVLTDFVENKNDWKNMFADNATSIWVDNNTGANWNKWTIDSIDVGFFNIGNLGVTPGKLNVHGDEDTRLYIDTIGFDTWAFVSEADYAKYLADKTVFDEALAEAAKENTEVGTDIILAAPSNWVGATGVYGSRAERYNTSMYTGDVMTQTIDGLVPGTKYEVTFEAAASYTSGRGFEGKTGLGLTGLFVNEGIADIEVVDQTAASDFGPYTVVGTVDEEGKLTYGLKNVYQGGNWFVVAVTAIVVTDGEVSIAPAIEHMALLVEFDEYKAVAIAAANDMAVENDSEAAKALITDAKAAIEALVYDDEKSMDENKAAVDSIINKLAADLEVQRALDANIAAFAEYQAAQATAVAEMVKEDDSEASKALIAAAKAAIEALNYDAEKSLEENKAAVDAIVAQLVADLAAQREADFMASLVFTDLTKEMFHVWTAADATGTMVDYGMCDLVLGTSTGMPYGNGNVYYLEYADLSNCARLVIVATEGEPRILFNRVVDDGTVQVEFPRDREAIGFETVTVNEDGSKTYTIDLTGIVEKEGFAHLHAIKGADWANTTVTSMKLGAVSEENFPSAIESLSADSAAEGKLIINGKLFIVREGKTYDANGLQVK